jgi:hypothetical protein
MNAIIAPGFPVLAAYVGGLRARAAAEDIAKRRCARRLARVLDKIAAGVPVIVTGETIIRDWRDDHPQRPRRDPGRRACRLVPRAVGRLPCVSQGVPRHS